MASDSPIRQVEHDFNLEIGESSLPVVLAEPGIRVPSSFVCCSSDMIAEW